MGFPRRYVLVLLKKLSFLKGPGFLKNLPNRVRIRLPKTPWKRKVLQVLLIAVLVVTVLGTGTFLYFWRSFARVIEARMSGEIFDHAARIYGEPDLLAVGSPAVLNALVGQLRRFGYTGPEEPPTEYGSFVLEDDALEIRPGQSSLVGPRKAVRVEVRDGEVTRLTSLVDGRPLGSALIDPPHVTNLFGRDRTKRRLVVYTDIPPMLVQAVLAAEDRRFFDHPGISFMDGLRVLWYDMGIIVGFRKGVRPHGASTLNMQLARSYFLSGDLTLSWKRKITEAFLALQIDQRFTKEKIFELYANEIYLGQRGSFSIHGFGEATQAYFGKDISQLTLDESALLAGLIRGPNSQNPYRHPERAIARRNHVLNGMVAIRAITEEEADAAKAIEELELATLSVDASEAPYFVDLVRERLLEQYSEEDLVSGDYRVYSTLDLKLQRAATEAVREALVEVDERIAKRYEGREEEPPKPQVALIAMDPHTGAIKALVGGRDYTESQLNHAIAHRQPGSSFKPFVYAAAFSKALEDPENAITPLTTVVDEPTVFYFGDEEYSPGNFGEKFFGIVTVRQALIKSLNVATVKIAEMTGYERVVELAVAAGMNPRLRPTPAMAIGAYDSTPLEVAGAYTIFANYGQRVSPGLIQTVLSGTGDILGQRALEPELVLDPRVAYLVVNLMADNLNRGTGAGARSRGFHAPGAGKTGTSRDAWFVGFTSNLLAVVWIGFDDYSDLGLPGGTAALPVWAGFMARAVEMPAYRDTEDFIPPEGIVFVPVDPETRQMATPDCPEVRSELFLVGTEPRDLCPLHRPSIMRRFSRALSGALGIGGRRDRDDQEKDDKKNPGNPDGNNPQEPDRILNPDGP